MLRPGRRQGVPDTRGTIIEAARAEFLELGYNATTIRSVARRARVDPALIYHYFTDKATLYASTLELPADPQQIMREVQDAPASPGARLVAGFLAQWESQPQDAGKAFVTMVQAISSSPEAARSLREFLSDRIWAPLAENEQAQWRTAVISSQLMGLAWNRYVMRAEPLASASLQEVAERVGPVIESMMYGWAQQGHAQQDQGLSARGPEDMGHPLGELTRRVDPREGTIRRGHPERFADRSPAVARRPLQEARGRAFLAHLGRVLRIGG
jgi:AcrR family transcriptional regulator